MQRLVISVKFQSLAQCIMEKQVMQKCRSTQHCLLLLRSDPSSLEHVNHQGDSFIYNGITNLIQHLPSVQSSKYLVESFKPSLNSQKVGKSIAVTILYTVSICAPKRDIREDYLSGISCEIVHFGKPYSFCLWQPCEEPEYQCHFFKMWMISHGIPERWPLRISLLVLYRWRF